jgi:hypothetical protein
MAKKSDINQYIPSCSVLLRSFHKTVSLKISLSVYSYCYRSLSSPMSLEAELFRQTQAAIQKNIT